MTEKINYKKITAWSLVTQYIQISLTIVYGVLLLPIYLKYIPADTYGFWMATGNMMMWFSLLMPDWSQLLLQQLGSAYGANDKGKFGKLFCSGIFISLLFVTVFLLASWLASSFFGSWLNLPEKYNYTPLINAFLVAAFGTALTAFGSTLGAVNLALHHTLADGISNIISMIVRILVILIFLFNGHGVLALGLGNLSFGVTSVIFNAMISFFYLRKLRLVYIVDFNNLLSVASLTFYSSVNKMGNTFMKQLDYFLIARFIGGEAATMLRLVKVVPETLLLFATNASVSLMPSISHSKGANSLAKNIEKIMQFTGIMFAFACYLGGGIYALEDVFIGLWVKSPVPIEQTVVFLVVTNLVIAGIADTFGRYVFTIGEIKRISIIRFTFSLFQMLFMCLGVFFWNLPGMLISSILVYTWSAVMFLRILVKIERLPPSQWSVPLKDLGYGAIAAGIAGICIRHFEFSGWAELFIGCVMYSVVFWVLLTTTSRNYRSFQQAFFVSLLKKQRSPECS